MPQAIGDPDEMKRFARELHAFTGLLGDRMAGMQGSFSRLGDTWRDQQFQKFAQDFQQTMVQLRHFIQTADAHIPLLQAHARALEEYLRRG